MATVTESFGTSTAMTITLASLASSTSGVGRQSTLIDNSTDGYDKVRIFVKLELGTSPTSSKPLIIYALKGDDDATTEHITDGAGASDAALTVVSAQRLGTLHSGASAATGDILYGEFDFDSPGPTWGVAVVHETGVNLDSTASNHWVRYLPIQKTSA